MRSSRISICRVAGMAATGLIALASYPAFGQSLAAERELLGVHIWRDWRTVMAKWGPPTRIEAGGGGNTAAGGGAGDLLGGGAPGMPAMGGGMGLPGLPGMGPGGGGSSNYAAMMMSRGGAGGAPSAMMGSGRIPGMGGISGMGGGMGVPGGKGMADDLGGGMPGGPGGLPSMGGGGGGASSGSSSEGEVTWVYDRGGLNFQFLFNKDGRVIQIQEFGYKGGGPTSKGVTLGDPASKIYQAYGWAGATIQSGNQLALDYSNKRHVAFQLLNNKVVGITVALTERGGPGSGINAAASIFPGAAGGGMMGGGMPGMGPQMGAPMGGRAGGPSMGGAMGMGRGRRGGVMSGGGGVPGKGD